MARQKTNGSLGGLLALIVGGLVPVAQDVIKDETESFLKRNGLWPR